MILVLLLSLAIGQTTAASQKGTAEVHGRITDAETGAPLPGVTIHLGRLGEAPVRTRTDDSGEYRFDSLPAGSYTGLLMISSFDGTHVSRMPLVSVPGAPARLGLSDGERRELNIAVPRAHAIQVRVVDEWGDPLSGISVSALEGSSQRTANDDVRQRTDDQGRVRLFGLSPGEYTLCAAAGSRVFSPGATNDRVRLLPTCYPSARDARKAAVVRVDRSDIGELEITMRRGEVFTVTGIVSDESGNPAPARVSLTEFTIRGSSSRFAPVKDGRFEIPDVLPGQYALEAEIGGPNQPQERRPSEGAFVPIDVQADMDLVVRTKRTVDVHGRITLDDPHAEFVREPGYAPMAIRTRFANDSLLGSGSGRHTTVRTDRTFTLTGMFGPRRLHLVNIPRGWFLNRSSIRGRTSPTQPWSSTTPANRRKLRSP